MLLLHWMKGCCLRFYRGSVKKYRRTHYKIAFSSMLSISKFWFLIKQNTIFGSSLSTKMCRVESSALPSVDLNTPTYFSRQSIRNLTNNITFLNVNINLDLTYKKYELYIKTRQIAHNQVTCMCLSGFT